MLLAQVPLGERLVIKIVLLAVVAVLVLVAQGLYSAFPERRKQLGHGLVIIGFVCALPLLLTLWTGHANDLTASVGITLFGLLLFGLALVIVGFVMIQRFNREEP